jgi:hypothetical protein
MNAIIVGVLTAVVPSVLGHTVSYINDDNASRHAFVNQQLEKLYGSRLVRASGHREILG